jgi:hypothetical protein
VRTSVDSLKTGGVVSSSVRFDEGIRTCRRALVDAILRSQSLLTSSGTINVAGSLEIDLGAMFAIVAMHKGRAGCSGRRDDCSRQRLNDRFETRFEV